MACESCTQKLKEANEAKNKIVDEAQAMANRDGVWYGIYTDEKGVERIIRADLAQNYPIRKYVSPKLPDASI
jgi:(2Fe-2S) ferredoxin